MIDKIAILGDFNPVYETHHKLNDSSRDVQRSLNKQIQFDWIPTDTFNCRIVFEKHKYSRLWIAPGSPYKDAGNVLRAIKYTRENNIPTFGNCGGFQYMIIEFAKNVCGIENADHEEVNPDGPELLITKLTCSLVGEQENLKIIERSSILYKSYGKTDLPGKYYCSYGINEKYIEKLKSKGMMFTSKSEEEHFRSFEIKGHPFFVGTLFQPALMSTKEDLDPIIVEFIKTSL